MEAAFHQRPLTGILVLVRHGASEWNLNNTFTGWTDVPLAPRGIEEAHQAAKKLQGLSFDMSYTSLLCRAADTLKIILNDLHQEEVPVMSSQALNERHYGDLQGKNKAETAKLFGADQVRLWRRSYDTAPPNGESLKDTCERTLPYFQKEILPKLAEGKNVLICAHGNSLRGIVMFLEHLSPEEIPSVEIPTGIPWVYEFDDHMKITKKMVLNEKM